ncbi:alpha/beta hydrolase [Alloalcanivorax marinus]|uniref:alpha/beta hydrolase n=1 Tax=Alloalcanivorax marinus TaxID=1177169 RepID=UPI001932E6F0|nr:alpha/beta hydrolase-fold protein [Alloalcanivorax marinus]MBL7249072.1 alpha/beta hydrolase [Alloalcanivorax marinus]
MSIDRRRRSLCAALAGVGLLPATVLARPDMTRTMGTTLADTGSRWYRLRSWRLDAGPDRRAHRIWLAIPRAEAPAAGYPVLYLLDGNATLARLREEWLAPLIEGRPPVLVMIGYDTDLMFDGAARQRDYTPPRPDGTRPRDRRHPDRESGGAARFLDRIERHIVPRVADTVAIDPTRRALWGHSYGGLFTLFALSSRPTLFDDYFPTSPSLGWGDNVLNAHLERLAGTPPGQPARVWLRRGSEELRAPADADPATLERLRRQASERFLSFCDELADIPSLTVRRRIDPGLGHGPMFSASLPDTLRIAAGLAPLQDWSIDNDSHSK